jgi:hypothetical protein
MPAQPPFLTPILSPATSGPFEAMMARTRSAARGVSVITFGRARFGGEVVVVWSVIGAAVQVQGRENTV